MTEATQAAVAANGDGAIEGSASSAARKPALGVSRPVLLVHLLSLLIGLAILVHEDHPRLWFFGDDWDFIVNRGLHHPVLSIWQPHGEHWSTLPILLYRALYTVFGLHYLPYLAVALIAHLLLAHLIWRACIHEGVGGWVSTAIVAVFIVLGAGAENLTWAFQVGFIGSLLFGYLAMELARRRTNAMTDALVALSLLAALMCSTVGDVMMVAVAVFLFLSRSWITALRPLVLPVLCWGLWYGLVGRNAVAVDHLSASNVLGTPHFAWSGLAGALGATADVPRASGFLLVGLIIWTAFRLPVLVRSHPAVLGLAVGAVSFYFLTGLGRESFGIPTSSRYVYIAMALLIPLFATLVSLPWRWRFDQRVPIILGALTLMVVNVGLLRDFADSRSILVNDNKQQVLTTATLLHQGEPSLELRPIAYSADLTTTALEQLVRKGQLPIVAVSPIDRLTDEAAMDIAASGRPLLSGALSVVATARVVEGSSTGRCRSFDPSGGIPQVAMSIPPRGGSVTVHTTPHVKLAPYLQGAAGTVPGTPIDTGPTGVVVVNAKATGAQVIMTLPTGAPTVICAL